MKMRAESQPKIDSINNDSELHLQLQRKTI